MEKMINRAKSTLPPEARGASRPSGPKKPSPYAAENSAARPAPKRSNSNQQRARAGPALDAHELDGLICDRLREILGTPLMRQAAAATRAAGGKAGTPSKAQQPGSRAGRRPAWNSDWNGQPGGSGTSWEERPVGGAAGVGATGRAQGGSPPQAGGSTPGGARRPQGTPTRTVRSPGSAPQPPPLLDLVGANAQRRGAAAGTSARGPSGTGLAGTGDRVVLLSSPTAAAAAPGLSEPGRSASGRYGGSGGGADPRDGPRTDCSHALERSTVSAIVTLNPAAPAAQEAAARLRQYSQGQGQGQHHSGGTAGGGGGSRIPRPGGPTTGGAGGAAAGDASAQSLLQLGASSASVSAPRGGVRSLPGEAAATQSLASLAASAAGQSALASAGGTRRPGVSGSVVASSSLAHHPHRPNGAHAAAAAGAAATASPPPTLHRTGGGGGAAAPGAEEEDEYADDDFEAYEGSEDGEGAAARAAEGGDEGGADEANPDDGDGDGQGGPMPDVTMLRQSVKALNGLVKLKIQQELSRQSQPHHQTAAARSSPPPLLASLPLVGSDPDADGAGCRHAGGGGGGLGASGSLLDLDGLRQSDLDYLARLGAGELADADGHEGSEDERGHVIEPGAPAGTAKAWGDRAPWTEAVGAEATATGLQLLRERQERAREREQAGGAGAEAAGRRSRAEEEDEVLLGETIPPGQRSAAASQMQAVSSALTALAGSGALGPADAADLASQTDALYGSLLQLHQLMTGPRGSELRAPAGGAAPQPASGFSPGSTCSAASAASAVSSESPTNTVGAAGSGRGSAAASGGGRGSGLGSPPPPLQHVGDGGDYDGEGGGDGGAEGGGGSAAGGGGKAQTHMQLTPKNCLVAEDIAWMAGLVRSLSRSLTAEAGGVAL